MKKKKQSFSLKKSRLPKQALSLSKKTCLIIIFIATLLVVGSLILAFFFNPQRMAEQKLEYLTKVYYEDYYQKLVGDLENPDLSTLEEYSETGLPSVNLRQLLSFDDSRYANFERYFTNEKYLCDISKTSVKYYPFSPYGANDYEVTYNYACTKE